MPLDGASAEDAPLASAPDPYEPDISSATSPSLTRYTPGVLPSHIDPKSLASPLPFTGYTITERDDRLVKRLCLFEKQISRPLAPHEQTALSQNAARGFALASWGVPVTAAWSLWRVRRTYDTQKCPPFGPLITDKVRKYRPYWDGQTLRAFGKEDLFRIIPPASRFRLLHLVRLSSYFAFGYFLMRPIFLLLPLIRLSLQDQQDPRLKDVMESLQQTTRRAVQERVHQAPARQPAGSLSGSRRRKGEREGDTSGGPSDPMGKGQEDMRELWGRHRSGIEKGASTPQEVDDASPTGGMGIFGFDALEDTDTSAAKPSTEDCQVGIRGRSAEARQGTKQSLEHTGRARDIARGRSQQRRAQQADDHRARAGDSDEMTAASDPGPSVWERLRQGSPDRDAVSQKPSTRRGKQQQRDQDRDDDFSISKADEEKNYAKSEAQREFDEELERERRGDNVENNDKKW